MKTISFLKKHLILAFALMMGVVAMSFAAKKEQPLKKATVYYYISNAMAEGDFRNPANWSTTDNLVPCGEPKQQLPCKITVEANSTLNDVLGTRSNASVLGISDGFKPYH